MIKPELRWGVALLTCLAGCTPPSLHGLQDPTPSAVQPEGPTVAQLVTHIQCEVKRAAAFANSNTTLKDYMKLGYVGEVSLTVDVVDAQGTTPTFSLIRNFSKISNVTLGLSGQYSRSRHRNFNYYFPLKINDKTTPCDVKLDVLGKALQPGLSNDLGLASIVYTGMWARQYTDEKELPPAGTGLQAQLNLGFSSQLDFTVVRGGAGGPTWTFASFKGPAASGGSGITGGPPGLFSLNNTVKDTMVVSFAPILTHKTPSPQTKAANANLDAAISALRLDLPAINSAIQSLVRPPLPNAQLSGQPDRATAQIEENIAAADHDAAALVAPTAKREAQAKLAELKARALALAEARDVAARRLREAQDQDGAGDEGAAYAAAQANLERFQLEQLQGLLH